MPTKTPAIHFRKPGTDDPRNPHLRVFANACNGRANDACNTTTDRAAVTCKRCAAKYPARVECPSCGETVAHDAIESCADDLVRCKGGCLERFLAREPQPGKAPQTADGTPDAALTYLRALVERLESEADQGIGGDANAVVDQHRADDLRTLVIPALEGLAARADTASQGLQEALAERDAWKARARAASERMCEAAYVLESVRCYASARVMRDAARRARGE